MNMDSINKYIFEHLSDKRKLHTEGVRVTAVKLARLYGADVEKAEIAALVHDMFRGVEKERLNDYVRDLQLDRRYLNNSNLAHSKIAAAIIKTMFFIDDEEIIDAVSYHTTGRAGMSLLEKIIYIADAIEPNRDYPGVAQLRQLAEINLDQACLTSLNQTIDYVRSQGNLLDQDTILAKEYLIGQEVIQKENLNGK